MARSALTGQRIRERRLSLGLKQADLAAAVGISASYLNLIEHDRRRIGGALLNAIAEHLGTESTALSEGAEAALVAALKDTGPQGRATMEPAEDFAERFPGWAAHLVGLADRARGLEQSVEALTDRLAHDPFLSTSLHEVLSSVTAIRSSASILSEMDDIDPEWQARFIRNIRDDSHRLGEGAEALVTYLDRSGDRQAAAMTPEEEFESALEMQGHHLEAVEADDADAVRLADTLFPRLGAAARVQAKTHLERAILDARALPLAVFHEAAGRGDDPVTIAARFGVSVSTVLRRWASLPQAADTPGVGLVVCDMSGALVFRKPVGGFPLPRFGSVCPLWPIFQALARPMQPIRAVIELGERAPDRFLVYAVAEPKVATGFGAPQVLEAVMLLLPEGTATFPDDPPQRVGTTCRICARSACPARREPSVLGEVS